MGLTEMRPPKGKARLIKMSELNDFFANLPGNNDKEVFQQEVESPAESQPENSETGETSSVDKQDEPEVPFHKHPRFKKLLEEKRDLESKVEKLSELEKYVKETRNASDDIPAEWISLYGDDDKAKQAWNVQKKLLEKVSQESEERAYTRLKNEVAQRENAEKQFSEFIDTSLEDIEQTYNVDLTSNAPAAKKARAEFLDMVQKLSPKDGEGNVTAYADFSTTWEIYQSTRQKKADASRNKDLAARSMTKANDTVSETEGYVPGMGFDAIMDKFR